MKLQVERQILKLVGATVRTFDENRTLLCKAEAKAFTLKEQVNFYKDEAKTQQFFSMQARQIMDFGATYDIFDQTGTKVAALRRKGMASAFVRDEWLILNQTDQEIGTINEDSNLLGVLRRYFDFVALFVPQKFVIATTTGVIGTIEQNKNPLTVRLACDFSDQIENQLGTLLPIAIPSIRPLLKLGKVSNLYKLQTAGGLIFQPAFE